MDAKEKIIKFANDLSIDLIGFTECKRFNELEEFFNYRKDNNLLNEFASLHLLSAEYLRVFNDAQLQAKAMLSYDLYLHGYEIANIFFALWLVPLGLLVYKSDFLPRAMGILLIVGGSGLLINVFVHFLLPGHQIINDSLLIPQFFAEALFTLWILIRGINESKVKLV